MNIFCFQSFISLWVFFFFWDGFVLQIGIRKAELTFLSQELAEESQGALTL